MPKPVYRHLESLDWETLEDVAPELREFAAAGIAAGARRARLTRGEMGFHSALNEMPAGFEVPPHRHDCAEIFVVLAGGCTVVDGTSLVAGDVAAIPGGMEYGFRVGSDGLRFVVIRADEAGTWISPAW